MIVDCESCHTRFRLDEARIPATGAKVRCSRCKAAFVVQRPDASRAEIIEEVVAEATHPGAPRAPTPTEDLFETGGSASLSPREPAGERSGDEKWEFDEGPRDPAVATKGAPAMPARALEPAADAGDLDALGEPKDWDLLGSSARQDAAGARFAAPPSALEVASAVRRPAGGSSAPRIRSVDHALATAIAEPVAAAAERGGWLQTLRAFAALGIESGMWFAAIALCGAGLAIGFWPRTESAALERAPMRASFLDKSIDLQIRRLESATGGTLTFVSGQLPPSAATREPLRLRATWLGAQGAQIVSASAIAGPPLSHRKLREVSLERLQNEYEAHALELTAGGAFEAVFAELPAAATSISLTRERVPVPAAQEAQEGEAAGAATASSRPSAPLSSE